MVRQPVLGPTSKKAGLNLILIVCYFFFFCIRGLGHLEWYCTVTTEAKL